MSSTQCFVKLLYLSAILYVVTISNVCSEPGDANNTTTQPPASTTALDTTTLDDENTTLTIETTTAISTQPNTSSVTTQPTGDQSTTEISTQPSTSSVTTQPTGDQSTTEISTQPSTISVTTQPTGDQSTTETMEATTEETTTPRNEEISTDNPSSSSQTSSESSTESPTNTTSATETITTSSSDTTQGLNITTSEAPVPTSTQETDNTTSAPDTSSHQTSDSNPPSSNTVETTQQSTTSTSINDFTTEATTDVATTQPPIITTKQTYQVEPIYPSIENAVLELKLVLKFNGCSHNKTTIESKLSSVSSNINGCEYLRVRRIKSCSNGRRKRSASESQVSVDTALGIDAQVGISSGSNVSNEMYASLVTVEGIDLTYLNDSISNITNTLTSQSICDSDSCRGALIGRPGFVCVDETFNNKQRCAILYYCDHHPIDCGKHGQCYVETDSRSTSYVSKCRCSKEDYFRYEGAGCTEKVLTWELAIIICASAGGVLILILLCVIVTLCCRNSSNSADVSFEESELIYSPSGITSTSHYKNGIENRGYMEVRETSASGSWKPEDSANT